MEEALAPFADDLPGEVQALADLLVLQAFGGHEHNLGPDHLIIRRRIFCRHGLEAIRLLSSEYDLERALSRHIAPPFRRYDSMNMDFLSIIIRNCN